MKANKRPIQRSNKIKGKSKALLFETDLETFKRLQEAIYLTGLTKRDILEAGLKLVLCKILK